jgi:hypothetical protein
MKSAALIMSLIALPVMLPAQAKDSDDLGSWSLEELCEKKDKDRHAEAIFAEIERRAVFSTSELELIREGRIDIGFSEAALYCSWGEPRATESRDGGPWQVYYQRREGYRWTVLLRIDSSLVAEVRLATDISAVDPRNDSFSRGGYAGNPGRSLSEQASVYEETRKGEERQTGWPSAP